MKICAKITIIVVENREPYYFIIICKCKEVSLSLFSYQMLASTLTTDERSSYLRGLWGMCKQNGHVRLSVAGARTFFTQLFFQNWRKNTKLTVIRAKN